MSKQQLTIEHLAPYLPYQTPIMVETKKGWIRSPIHNLTHGTGIGTIGHLITSESFKIGLRPLSDLTKEIEHNGERFYPIGKLHNSSYRRQGSVCKSEYEVNEMIPGIITTKKSSFSQGVEVYLNRVDNNKQWIINYLLKWHFDVFSLIDQNLAINLNEVK